MFRLRATSEERCPTAQQRSRGRCRARSCLADPEYHGGGILKALPRSAVGSQLPRQDFWSDNPRYGGASMMRFARVVSYVVIGLLAAAARGQAQTPASS